MIEITKIFGLLYLKTKESERRSDNDDILQTPDILMNIFMALFGLPVTAACKHTLKTEYCSPYMYLL